jgi:TonB family protein
VLRFSVIFCFGVVLAASYVSSAQDASPDAKPLLKACSHKNHAPCIDKPPAVLHSPDPDYSVAAHNAKIEGTVVLLITIGTDGLAHDIHVARSLGYGLDELAVEAVKKWTFKPAKSAGKAVPAQVNIEVLFRYH